MAEDPEGADIVWSLPVAADVEDTQDLDDNGEDNVGPDEVADAGSFSISSSGVLTFNSSPDYEDEGNMDHEYRVVVQASDGGTMGTRNWFVVTVTVNNVEEEGAIDLEAQEGFVLLQPQVMVGITATLDDPDGGVADVTWQWYRSTSRTGTRTEIEGATDATYIPRDATDNDDTEKYLSVMASYTDGEGPGKTAVVVSRYLTLANIEDNTSPIFTDGDDTRRAVLEEMAPARPSAIQSWLRTRTRTRN